MYGSIGHRFNARNYFRSRRNRKYKNVTTADVNTASRPVYEARTSTFGRLKPFPVKPEVEIWRKPENELAAIDFLFDTNTMYGSIGHHFDARNYFRSHRNRKYWNLTSADLRYGSKRVPLWLTAAWQHIFAENRRPTAIFGQTGSGNAAETAHINSQPLTSYSTPYTLWGLSRLLLPLCRRDRLHWPIIMTFGLRKFTVGDPMTFPIVKLENRNLQNLSFRLNEVDPM